jgi:hypothetical protein
LPRPTSVNPLLAQDNGSSITASASDENMAISNAIGNELVQLLGYENFAYPVVTKSSGKKGSKQSSSRPVAVELEDIDDEYLAAARESVAEEAAVVMQSLRDGGGKDISHCETGIISVAEYSRVWEEQAKQLVYVANPQGSGGSYRPTDQVSKAELLSSLEIQHQALKSKIDRDAKKCAKLEQKIGVKTQGYVNIADGLEAGLRQSFDELDSRTIELGKNLFYSCRARASQFVPFTDSVMLIDYRVSFIAACFRTLRESEVRAVSRRVAAARKDLSIAEVSLLCRDKMLLLSVDQ